MLAFDLKKELVDRSALFKLLQEKQLKEQVDRLSGETTQVTKLLIDTSSPLVQSNN